MANTNNTKAIKTDDNLEFYYLPDEDLTGTTISGLARLGDFTLSTVQQVIKRLEHQGSISLKSVQVPTAGGVHMAALILENDIPEVLMELQNGKTSQKTKESAANLIQQFTQGGDRYQEMLENDPVALFKEVINRITDPREAKELSEAAALQVKKLNPQEESETDHYARYDDALNKLAGIEDGDRSKMTDEQKENLTIMHIFSKRWLRNYGPTNGPDHAVEIAIEGAVIGMIAIEAALNFDDED